MLNICTLSTTYQHNVTICSINVLSFGSKDYSKEMKTIECASFLSQTSHRHIDITDEYR